MSLGLGVTREDCQERTTNETRREVSAFLRLRLCLFLALDFSSICISPHTCVRVPDLLRAVPDLPPTHVTEAVDPKRSCQGILDKLYCVA